MEVWSTPIPLICLPAEVPQEGVLSESRTCSAGQCIRAESVEEDSACQSHRIEGQDHALRQTSHSQTGMILGQKGIVLLFAVDRGNRSIWRANNRRGQTRRRRRHEANRLEIDGDWRYVYFHSYGSDPALYRVRMSDHGLERIVDLKGIRLAIGAIGSWCGLAPDDTPLILRDVGTQEIYSLDLQLPYLQVIEEEALLFHATASSSPCSSGRTAIRGVLG